MELEAQRLGQERSDRRRGRWHNHPVVLRCIIELPLTGTEVEATSIGGE
jgi:hypothetical protein